MSYILGLNKQELEYLTGLLRSEANNTSDIDNEITKEILRGMELIKIKQ